MELLHVVIFALALTGASTTSRIVGGSLAPDGLFPYQVSLRTKTLVHTCSGTIIGANSVLTAAACVYGKAPGDVYVVAGTNYLTPSGTTYAVSVITTHITFDPNTLKGNLAVIKTIGRILDTPKTAVINLNIASTLPGQVCTLSGWGKKSSTATSYSNELMYTSLEVMSLDECRKAYPQYDIDNNIVCTKGGNRGGCDGDNGSPLVSFGLQVGLLSWGIPCATGKPDVFTNLAPYNNWITNMIS
ncbi:hypothetical protein FQR65_LT05039 [Abscondita terminalis]|nr:hypothetical protein FQR65_LT05039 [Abscondita terminalis]